MLPIALASGVFFLSAMYARKLLGSWMHPGAMLLLLWSFVFISTSLFAADYYFSFFGGFLLYTQIVSFLLGSTVGSYSLKEHVKDVKSVVTLEFQVKGLTWILLAGIVCGFLAVAFVLATQGVSIGSFTDIDELAETAHDFSVARYEDDYRMPVLARLLLSFNYVAVSLSGLAVGAGRALVWREGGVRRRLLLLVPLIPQVVLAVVMTTRAQVLFEMVVWFAFYLAASVYVKDRSVHRLFSFKKVFFISLVGVFVLVLFVSLQFLRGGITDFDRIWDILEHIRKWPFGSIAGFSVWADMSSFSDPSFGAYTFTGIFDLLGIKQRDTGLYSDYVDLGDGSYGNVYSVFRGIIQDFGVVGACFFLVFSGVLGGRTYAMAMRGSKISAVSLLAAFYMAVIWSPMMSVFAYFSMVFDIVVVFLILVFFSRVRSRG